LAELMGPGGELSQRGLTVELNFSGPDAHELRLGELNFERNRHWQLRTGVQGVSFPRCGHHMLAGALKRYFGSSFEYCGFYQVCAQRPCPGEVTHLQKNHDHHLELPTDEPCDYLIQYRHPLSAVSSQFEHKLRYGESAAFDDTRRNWEDFAVSTVDRWREWVKKWLLENKNSRALRLSYEEVMSDPLPALARVMQFFAPDDPLDVDRLRRLVRNHQLAPRRNLQRFRYFDRVFFHDLESMAAEELSALGLPEMMAGAPRRRADRLPVD
jgi:hypothetical protein